MYTILFCIQNMHIQIFFNLLDLNDKFINGKVVTQTNKFKIDILFLN